MSKHQLVNIIFVFLSVVYFLLFNRLDLPIGIFIGLLLIWLLIIVFGSFSIQANYHLKAICKVQTKKKVIALTFDDGPTKHTLEILELLKKQNQKATFFCIGKQVEKFPEIARQIIKEQHEIGNHTFSHSKTMGFKDTKFVVEEILSNKELIEKTINVPIHLFRPPFGVTNPTIRKAVKQTKQTVIGWNIRSLDGVQENEEKIYNRIIKKLTPGSIILLHDTSPKSVKILERLLLHLKEKNYTSVTISELLKIES